MLGYFTLLFSIQFECDFDCLFFFASAAIQFKHAKCFVFVFFSLQIISFSNLFLFFFNSSLYLDADLNHQSPQSGSNSPSAALNNSHKQNSLRNTKLARRARSFKDDVIGKIIQIRTPNANTLSLGR